MASNGSGGSGSSGDMVGNNPRKEDETLGVQTGSQSTGGGSTGMGEMSAMVGNPPTGGGDENPTTGGGGEQPAVEHREGAPVDMVVIGSPATASGSDDQMGAGDGERHAAVSLGGAPVGPEAVGSLATACDGAGGGLTEAALGMALRGLDCKGPQIGAHEPISARTTGSSTTEAVSEGPFIEDIMMEDDEGAEEAPRDQSKGKAPIVNGDPERQRAEELLRGGRMAFTPPQGSSTACLTYYDDFAEMMGEE